MLCWRFKTGGNEFKDGVCKESFGGCEVEPEPYITATLFRHTLSEVQKLLSTECMLHKKYLYSIFAELLLHNNQENIPNYMPTTVETPILG
jgi:hypothetical protein